MNNVIYYSYFDTVINHWAMKEAGLDPNRSSEIGLCIASSCTFLSELSYPNVVEAALAVESIGRTSLTYHLGVFAGEGSDTLAAVGSFTHVFVDRESHKPTPISDSLRSAALAISRTADPARL